MKFLFTIFSLVPWATAVLCGLGVFFCGLMLVAKGLRKAYRSREVVRDFGLTLDAGEQCAGALVMPQAQMQRAEALLDAITAAAIGMGGVISGEHGLGCLKHHHLDLQLDERNTLGEIPGDSTTPRPDL